MVTNETHIGLLSKVKYKIYRAYQNKKFAMRADSDLKRLVEMYPEFSDINTQINDGREKLNAAYIYYKTNISIGNSAASIETAALLDLFARNTGATRILDLGSGFSSYVLRKYQKDCPNEVDVWSVDSDQMWLEKTKEYLHQNELNTNNMFHWDQFVKQFNGKFDLVFLDMRPISARVEWIERLHNALNINGLLIVDDVHKDHLMTPILSIYSGRFDQLVNLKNITLDSLGRYALLVHSHE